MSMHGILRVMYGPLDYAHPHHRVIDGVNLACLPAPLANQWIIDHHCLDVTIPVDWCAAPLVRQCVSNWAHLPRVGFLIGVQLLRAALVEDGWYPQLDASSQRFLCLPLPCVPKIPWLGASHDHMIFFTGLGFIASMLRDAPLALRQRLPLLFPPSNTPHLAVELCNYDHASTASAYSLFSFAMNHALLEATAVA